MPKPKLPPLADWEVSFLAGVAFPRSPFTVRATCLRTREHDYVLEDTFGNVLFAAPRNSVLCVRRLEPGQDAPAAKEAPKQAEDVPLPDPGSPAAEKVARPQARGKRGGTRS